MFNKGIFKTETTGCKVISVGNITVGGSGKTPAVIMISKILKDAGIKSGILSRGYGRNTKGFLLVSDGEKMLAEVDECGDEIYFASMECKVAAAVCEKRTEGAQKLNKLYALETIVLDDAFQHRWIHRDLDILIFDQRFLLDTNTIDQNLLPLGVMREPFSSVKRADIIMVNRKFDEKYELPENINKYFKGKNIFYGYYTTAGFYDVKNHEFFNLNDFAGQKSLVVSGIANPVSFLSILAKNKIDADNQLIFQDHKNYSLKEIQLIRKKFYDTNANSVITTQKDAVKLKYYAKELDDIDIYYLKIDLKIENSEKLTKIVLSKQTK